MENEIKIGGGVFWASAFGEYDDQKINSIARLSNPNDVYDELLADSLEPFGFVVFSC